MLTSEQYLKLEPWPKIKLTGSRSYDFMVSWCGTVFRAIAGAVIAWHWDVVATSKNITADVEADGL